MLALALALAALVIIAITFRGLVFLTLPLAIAALVLGIVGGRSAKGGGDYAMAMVGIVLAGVALLLSLLALAATILISRDYNVYDISSHVPAEMSNES